MSISFYIRCIIAAPFLVLGALIRLIPALFVIPLAFIIALLVGTFAVLTKMVKR